MTTAEFGHYPFAWGEVTGNSQWILSATNGQVLGQVERTKNKMNWYAWDKYRVSIGNYIGREAAAQAVAKWGWENVVKEGEATPSMASPPPTATPLDLLARINRLAAAGDELSEQDLRSAMVEIQADSAEAHAKLKAGSK